MHISAVTSPVLPATELSSLALLEQLTLLSQLSTAEQAVKLAEFSSIKRFQLSAGLTEFPRPLFLLADTLETLDLSANQLTELPDDFGRFHALKILFLSDNHFTQLPKVLAHCPKLSMVGFKANQIEYVAEDCLPLGLRWLILTDNKITQLPDSMGQLTLLQKCALAGNAIERLPESMAACQRLELLRVSANKLTELPSWLFSLPRLSWLAFDGNPVTQAVTSSMTQAMGNTAPISSSSSGSSNATGHLDTALPLVAMSQLDVGRELGRGASGIIYQAQWQAADVDFPKSVAVKLFKGAVTSDGYPSNELACSLKVGLHPNIIPVLGQINQPEALGLVMGLIAPRFTNLGLPPSLITCTRDTFVCGTEFSAAQILTITTQIADAMAHLHDKGVSHGDVYAHNILIDGDDKVIFGDFGAATDLSNLSLGQQLAMEQIEVRAFACLMDDLLGLVSITDLDKGLVNDLTAIKQACLTEVTHERPRFKLLCEQLNRLGLRYGLLR
ncbi:leucine-rich repeat-containing protein kinase family protein [Shewanella denitrificans]|uniref:leucine-rich repeat-containing protein kinase family protein n=1 Tax=Shewanella denitrificans TaxID=192073 RepID=UPI0000554505|nr:leucine-rich repeat-containing protein kinase family protein [Shewanella denitrificans]